MDILRKESELSTERKDAPEMGTELRSCSEELGKKAIDLGNKY